MTNEVTEYKDRNYYVQRQGEEKTIVIDRAQYENIEKVLIDTNAKFIKIGEKIIAVSSIREVGKLKKQEPFRAN